MIVRCAAFVLHKYFKAGNNMGRGRKINKYGIPLPEHCIEVLLS
jgi:hypothetical protein